jgi:hypothetical protein
VNTHEQVWGSEYGPLKFEKQVSFADEVPEYSNPKLVVNESSSESL